MKQLRQYQLNALNEILAGFQSVNKLLLVMPTGTGKSFTFFNLLSYFISQGKRVAVIVRKRNLVDQLIGYAENFRLPYGVYMSDHEKFNPSLALQLCSIDTLKAREQFPDADLVIIDEADEGGYEDILNHYNKILGATATPFNNVHYYEKYVNPIDEITALKEGYLVPIKYYVPEKKLDQSKVRIIKGEFVNSDLNKAQIVGDIVENYLLYGDNRRAVLFTNSIEKSVELAEKFNSNGIAAIHLDGETPDHIRLKAFNDLKEDKLKIICNVRVITRGTDIPSIGCIINAAPTTSLSLYIQKIGRGVRINDYYKDCIIIDHAGDCLNHGHFYERRFINLNSPIKFKRLKEDELKMRQCVQCFRAFQSAVICPFCGYKEPEKVKSKKEIEGDLKELNPEIIERLKLEKEYKKAMYLHIKFNKNKKYDGIIHANLIDKYGIKLCVQNWQLIKLKRWHVYAWAKTKGIYVRPEAIRELP